MLVEGIAHGGLQHRLFHGGELGCKAQEHQCRVADVHPSLHLVGIPYDGLLAAGVCRCTLVVGKIGQTVVQEIQHRVDGIESLRTESVAQPVFLILVGLLPVVGALPLKSLICYSQLQRVEVIEEGQVGLCPLCQRQQHALFGRAAGIFLAVDGLYRCHQAVAQQRCQKQVVGTL